MENATVHIGVIGAGDISAYHLAGLRAAGGAQVKILSGRRRERVAPVAEKFGVPEFVTDYRKVLERDDLDAVIITTPESSHEEIAVAAAKAGKAILLQKPVATSIDACERIIEAAAGAGVDLQVSYMHRFFEETVYARSLLRSGKLGRVHAVRIRNATPGPQRAWYYDPALAGGGVVWSLGVHGIDLVQHLFGRIADVHARTATMMHERTMPDGERVRGIELEDQVLATYRIDNGALVSHEMSTCELKGTDRFLLEVYCEKGTMLLRSHLGPVAIYAPEAFGTTQWTTPELPDVAFGARQHAHWLDILRGRARSDATARDALAGLHVVRAIYEAAASGSSARPPFVAGTDYAG